MIAFRSLLVPLTAAAGFLLSVAAAFGATVAVYQWGWLARLFNVHQPAPLLSFMPVVLVGVTFGLAMDYQVFLVSRMREDYVHGADARDAVREPDPHGIPRVGPVHVVLAHPGDQEDLVVHRQPERDADENYRHEAQQRSGLVHVEESREPAPLVHRNGGAEGGRDGEQEPGGSGERHQQRSEGDHQQQVGQPDDDQQEDRQCGAELRGDVDVGGGGAGDPYLGAGLLLDARSQLADGVHQVHGGLGVGTAGGDDDDK